MRVKVKYAVTNSLPKTGPIAACFGEETIG
jgi:hypothetical protein